MRDKLLFMLFTLLFTSCVNLASPVNNITVIKVIFGGKSKMEGSKLDDIADGFTQKAGDVKATPQ